jgi:hypothetical protein
VKKKFSQQENGFSKQGKINLANHKVSPNINKGTRSNHQLNQMIIELAAIH